MRREKQIFSEDEIRFLRELTRNQVPFMVVGLGAAALQGAPMVTQDVDLWFKTLDHPGLSKTLRALDCSLTGSLGLMAPVFVGAGVECFDVVLTVHGVGTFDEELKRSVAISMGDFELRAMPIDRIIASKTFLNREKDRMALPALKSALKALHARTPQPRPKK